MITKSNFLSGVEKKLKAKKNSEDLDSNKISTIGLPKGWYDKIDWNKRDTSKKKRR